MSTGDAGDGTTINDGARTPKKYDALKLQFQQRPPGALEFQDPARDPSGEFHISNFWKSMGIFCLCPCISNKTPLGDLEGIELQQTDSSPRLVVETPKRIDQLPNLSRADSPLVPPEAGVSCVSPSTDAEKAKLVEVSTRIEDAYNCALRLMPKDDNRESLMQAKKSWEAMARSYLEKGKGLASEQVSDVMYNSWDTVFSLEENIKTSLYNLRDAYTFNGIKHILLLTKGVTSTDFENEAKILDEDKKRGFDSLSREAKSLVEEYIRFTDGITDFEDPDLRKASIDDKLSSIRDGQREFLDKITDEQKRAIRDYSYRSYIEIFNFCRYDLGGSSSIALEPEHQKALAAITNKTRLDELIKGRDIYYRDLYKKIKEQVKKLDSLMKRTVPLPIDEIFNSDYYRDLYKEIKEQVKKLDSLMKCTVPQNVVVKTDIDMREIIPFLKGPQGEETFELKEGNTWQDKAFLATSLSLTHVYRDAYGFHTDTAIVFTKVPKDSPAILICDISLNPQEYEMLLPRNAAINIEKVRTLNKSELSQNDQRILGYLPTCLIQGRYVGIGDTYFQTSPREPSSSQ